MLTRIPGSLLVRASLLSLAVVVAAGCAEGIDPTGGAGGSSGSSSQSLADALRVPVTLDIAPTAAANTGSAAFIDAEQRTTGLHKQLSLTVLGGHVDLRALSDGELYIDELEADVGDIRVSSTVLPPNGLHLTGISATLAQPVDFNASWSADGNSATATVNLDLSMDWAMVRADGSSYPLSPVSIPNVPVRIKVTRGEDGAISVRLSGSRDGVFFDWAKVLDLSNLAVDFRTADPAHA